MRMITEGRYYPIVLGSTVGTWIMCVVRCVIAFGAWYPLQSHTRHDELSPQFSGPAMELHCTSSVRVVQGEKLRNKWACYFTLQDRSCVCILWFMVYGVSQDLVPNFTSHTRPSELPPQYIVPAWELHRTPDVEPSRNNLHRYVKIFLEAGEMHMNTQPGYSIGICISCKQGLCVGV